MAWTSSSRQFQVTGTGIVTVSAYEAWNIVLELIPDRLGQQASDPIRYFGVGWIAFGTGGFGNANPVSLEFADTHIYGLPLGTVRVAYYLAPGVRIGGYGLTWV